MTDSEYDLYEHRVLVQYKRAQRRVNIIVAVILGSNILLLAYALACYVGT